jgi:hypothetical protein
MSNITIAYRNILENSTVTVTTENTSFPKYRLYDRDIGKLFKGTAFASPFAIVVDQGATTTYEVDRLVIPVGHNLNGLVCKLQYSTTGAWGGEQVDALSWTQGDALLIDKPFTAATKRYWRLIITAPATIVEMPEMFLSKIYAFERNPSFGSKTGIKKNIVRDETQSGRVRRIKFGEPKLSVTYDLLALTVQKTSFESWDSATEGTKSFYVWDENAIGRFMELLNDIQFSYRANGVWNTSLELMETL